MKKYLYEYQLKIAKEECNSYFRLYKYEILLENEEQYVIAIGNKYSIVEKKRMFNKWFRTKDWLWNYSHYFIYLYSIEKNPKNITKIKRALKQLIEENNFLNEVENIDLKAMLKDKSE